MRVLIVGGGIAGCACAALLLKHKVAEVTLVEKAPEFRNIGYLIGLWSTGRKVLRELGIDERIAKNANTFNSDTVFDKNGKLLKVVPSEDLEVLGPPIIIKRSALHQGLFELLHDVDIRFNTTCTKIEQQDNAINVEFSDNKREVFDLVIGADGTNSVVRKLVFGESFIHHYGWRVWMWWLPNNRKQHNDVTSYYGNGKICATLPFFDTSVATLFAKVSPGSKLDTDKPKHLFMDFCARAQDIVGAASATEQIYSDDIVYVKMPRWHKGLIALIGDAQHAVSPVTGMGASMAMEDAWVLVEELRKNKSIQESLSNFAKRREKRINHFRKMVDRMDKWTMADGLLGYIRNKAIPLVPTWYFVNTMRRFVGAKI